MSIRLDPRRLAALKLLAAESNMRPGELVTAWLEERIDAARKGKVTAEAVGGVSASAFAGLVSRVDELARRIEAMTATPPADAAASRRNERSAKRAPELEPAATAQPQPEPAPAERQPEAAASVSRVPLHEEIADVIRERGPMSASEIATAIGERGRYSAPRSSRPLDAATVNSRVSNPAYRARFTRSEGRIGLA
jgi:chemotaxis protein histidine kinase CheA